MKSYKSFLEDVAANNVGAGKIAGTGGAAGEPGVSVAAQKRHQKRNQKSTPKPFAGHKVFQVNSTVYNRSLLGKTTRKWWSTFVGNDEVGQQIKEFATQNPNKAIIIQDELTGAMVYLRHPKRG